MTPAPSELFAGPVPVLLDGATGTELERRGYSLEGPGWSARALVDGQQVLAGIHSDYARAGAQILTANTFRLHRRNLADWGAESRQTELVETAIRLARLAGGKGVLVGASLAPLGDCYTPEDTPAPELLEREHRELAAAVARAGADLIVIETMVSGTEALAASRAARATGLPFLVSFVTGPNGTLLTGESLAAALAPVLAERPLAVGVNCLSCAHVPVALESLRARAGEIPIGVYANTGERSADGSWQVTTASEPAVYAGLAATWLDGGMDFLGGCCGTGPAHIAALQSLLWQRFAKK